VQPREVEYVEEEHQQDGYLYPRRVRRCWFGAPFLLVLFNERLLVFLKVPNVVGCQFF
jgi:hypothetical protein